MRSGIIGKLGLLFLLCGLAPAQGAPVQPEPNPDPYDQAQELEKRGLDQQAFWKYLEFPGGEHAAIKLARPRAKEYLELLHAQGQALPVPRFKLIEGDLLLALGKRAEALACYRAVAARIGTTAKQTWDKGFLPRDEYVVEVPPLSPRDDFHAYATFIDRAQQPFQLGPGSHRDNWLLRRFLALQAWDEAGREFARLWDYHLRYSEAYVTSRTEGDVARPDSWKTRDYLIRESGFSRLGLLFALDYAFFWKQRKDPDQALATLREAVLRLHMDEDYQEMWEPEPLEPRDAGKYPRQPGGNFVFSLGYGEDPAGVSPREFLRLAYGEFKTAGQEGRLVEMLEREIKLGKNRLRRVLARIRLQQGKIDEALNLELAYLKVLPRLDDRTRARRRAGVYEDFQKLAEAAAEYEKALAAPGKKPRQEEDRICGEILARLLALYAALGQTQKGLDLSLRQFDLGQRLTVWALEQAEQLFHKAGQEARFTAWLKNRRDQTTDAAELASLCWLLQDYPATLAALGKMARQKDSWWWQEQHDWDKMFVKLKMEREFLKVISAARPQEPDWRWRLLVLEDRTRGPEAIEVMEKMLEQAATSNQGYVATPLCVYPLLRLDEQHGQLDKLVGLGRRILRGEKPFEEINHTAYETRSQGVVGYDRQQLLVDCLLLILPYLEDEKDLQAFDKVAQHWARWGELRNQLALRRQGGKAQRLDSFTGHVRNYARVSVQTVGLPQGVRLLTTRDDVHAIAADGQWIGTSWGLVRYREPARDALQILQVPLGGRVTDILDTPAGLLVGTVVGLFRIDEPTSDRPRPVRILSLKEEPFLIWWRDQVWVEIPRHVLQYDPKTHEVRDHYQVDEWNGEPWHRAWNGEPWHRMLTVAADRLWNQDAVFDEKAGEFQRLPHGKGLCVLGSTGSEVWASVSLPNSDHSRPALIDPKILTVKVLPIANIKPKEPCSCSGILGADRDHVWFGPDPLLVYHRQTGKVELIRPSADDEKRAHQGPAFWQGATYGGLQRTYVESATSEGVPGLGPDRLTCWKKVAGKILVGAARPDVSIEDGGLFAVDPKTLHWTRVGHANSDLGDGRVNRIVFDDEARRAYVCTDGGVMVLSLPEGSIVERITGVDGLPSHRVTDAVRLGQKLYVACALLSPIYDEGGLAVIDTKTRLVQRFTRADGLLSYHIKRLRAEGGKVHVLYDTFRPLTSLGRDPVRDHKGAIAVGQGNITFKSSIFDPQTGTITPGNEILNPDSLPGELPFLGGSITVDVTHQGKRYLGGSHGLLILDDPTIKLEAALPTVSVKKVLTRSQRWQAEARTLQPRIATPDDLARFLRQENPLLREKAIDSLPEEDRDKYVPVLQIAARDSHVAVRRKAAEILKTLGTPEVAAVLKPLLEDADLVVRSNAAVGLARAGDMPDLKYFQEILRTLLSPLEPEVLEILARQNSPKGFALLVEHGMPWDRSHQSEYLKILAEQVNKNPELADMLLEAYDSEPSEESPEERELGVANRTELAAQVFWTAGEPILPVLYKALQSPDRVVRCNAARACGAIGNPAAVPHLIKALDLESGLSRAAIVEALGRLQARDALPVLIKLYVDAVNDDLAWGSPDIHHSGAGFRSSQLGVSQAAMYEHLSDLDALKGAWEDLKSRERQPPRDPRRHERLLTEVDLLHAIRAIGPENSPEFYRALAGDKKKELRQEAAIHFAAARPKDLDKNLAILRNLAADPVPEVQMTATVSLLLLKQPGAEKAIEGYLSSPADSEVMRLVLVALNRVEDGKRLAFARDRLKAIVADTTLHHWLHEQAGRLLRRIEPEKK